MPTLRVILLVPLTLLLSVFVCVDCVNHSPSHDNLSYFSEPHRSKNSNNNTNPELHYSYLASAFHSRESEEIIIILLSGKIRIRQTWHEEEKKIDNWSNLAFAMDDHGSDWIAFHVRESWTCLSVWILRGEGGGGRIWSHLYASPTKNKICEAKLMFSSPSPMAVTNILWLSSSSPPSFPTYVWFHSGALVGGSGRTPLSTDE